jgi:hypothetical protein
MQAVCGGVEANVAGDLFFREVFSQRCFVRNLFDKTTLRQFIVNVFHLGIAFIRAAL